MLSSADRSTMLTLVLLQLTTATVKSSDMRQNLLVDPPSFLEPVCNSTAKFNNVSWSDGEAQLTTGYLRFGCQGSVRQLHWHPYADEWAYVVKGTFVVTVTGPSNDPWASSVSRAPEGSVWFFPRGWWHMILCETDECELVLAFNNNGHQRAGTFIGKDDLDFVQAMLALPNGLAAATMGVTEKEYTTKILPQIQKKDFTEHNAISNSPKGSCDPVAKKCPLPAGSEITTFQPSVETFHDRAVRRRIEGLSSCKGKEGNGVDLYDMKASNFPFLMSVMQQRTTKRNADVGMSGQKMVLQPGATRPPVWIVNANAVLYVVEGPVDVIVYGGATSENKKTTYNERATKGDIVYIPITSMYVVQNPSCENNATVGLIFDHPQWEEQEMSKLSLFPHYGVAASLNLDYTPVFGAAN
jgi:oxalate decarboxylase/phosphoglucose isomerase-like protein (cupin superfamily)